LQKYEIPIGFCLMSGDSRSKLMARVLIILILTLSACETIDGMGQDISEGARVMKNAF